MGDLLKFPEKAKPDFAGVAGSVYAEMPSGQILGYLKYLRWRLDCCHFVDFVGQGFFELQGLLEYHKNQNVAEINFCNESIGLCEFELRRRGI
jgi:hypothetical protein